MSRVREHWKSRFGFIMATLGSAIGLGVLWKFPYVVGRNGGGFFLFAYFICVLLVGVPIFIAELILGRASQRAAIGAYEVLKPGKAQWKVAGYLGAASSFLIMSFYSVIAGWGMSYILMSLSGFYRGLSGAQVAAVFDTLSQAGGITLLWHFIFTLVTGSIVISGVRKGIERWAKIMTQALLVLLVLLFLYSLQLDGFGKAAYFIFAPNAATFKLSSVIEALGLAFWTLSIGQGIMISYGSYMRRSESIPAMGGIVAIAVIVVAILAALTIFPVVFTFNVSPGEGVGLIFKTMPYLFSKLPGALLLSTMFFTLFVFTALTSAIPLIEVVATNLMELRGWTRTKAVVIVSSATFTFGIPSALAYSGDMFRSWSSIYGMNFLDTIDNLVSIWVIPIGGLLSAFFVGWVVDSKIAQAEFLAGGKWTFLWRPWRFFIRFVVPAMLIIIIVQKSGLLDFDRLFHSPVG
ncbi:MAG: sodium-dependent transporter [Chlamydiota bacterium]